MRVASKMRQKNGRVSLMFMDAQISHHNYFLIKPIIYIYLCSFPIMKKITIGTSEQISFSSPILPWRYFSKAQVWLLPSQPNAELLFRSLNAVFVPVFEQQAHYGILIC